MNEILNFFTTEDLKFFEFAGLSLLVSIIGGSLMCLGEARWG